MPMQLLTHPSMVLSLSVMLHTARHLLYNERSRYTSLQAGKAPEIQRTRFAPMQAWRVFQRGLERWIIDLLQPVFDSLVKDGQVRGRSVSGGAHGSGGANVSIRYWPV